MDVATVYGPSTSDAVSMNGFGSFAPTSGAAPAVSTTPAVSTAPAVGNGPAVVENGSASASSSDISVSFSPNYAVFVAEQIGIADLPIDVAADVTKFVARLVRAVLSMARKFKDRARRRMLTTDDIDAATVFFGLSVRPKDFMPCVKEPQYGYKMALNHGFKQVGASGDELFVNDDREVELNTYINTAMPKLPLQPSIKSHWLVIDGVQPAIPENPVPPAAAADDTSIVPNGTTDDGTKEDGAIMANGKLAPMLLNAMARGVRKTEQVQIKTTTTHALSLEQQIFFKEVTEAIMGGDETKRLEALNCLMVDCGLQALLPRFSITIAEGVRCNIAQHNLAILIYLMRMVQSLVQNESLSLERCLHELLPAIMSCVLSRQLCCAQSDSHWALREFSARLLSVIAKKYEHPVLQSRITRSLARAFNDSNCSLATLYGAVFALNQLGADTTRAVVAGKAEMIFAAIRRALNDPNATVAVKNAANRLRGEMNSCMSVIERGATS